MSAAAKEAHAASKVTLTNDQKNARIEILRAMKPRNRHLLEGEAGTGKTMLVAEIARDVLQHRKTVVATAPTHKAVAVLAGKLAEAGLGHVPCMTTHALLSVEPKPGDDGRLRLVRRKHAEPVKFDVAIGDEASMMQSELIDHADRVLYHCFVLYVADKAQLNPVGERESRAFQTRSRSVLSQPVRQGLDNPVLAACRILRRCQETGAMDWSWTNSVKVPPLGVYRPGSGSDLWLQRAFTSGDFKENNDAFRYLCWTNNRVAAVNAKVRNWLYGETDMPFCPGERVLIRQPIMEDETVVFNTNEETPVEAIEQGIYRHVVEERGELNSFVIEIPSWRIRLYKEGVKGGYEVHMPRNDRSVSEASDLLASQANIHPKRWHDFYKFKHALARLQAVYAMTVHNSQGSTFINTFLDVPDIARRGSDDALEMMRLLYTGASRPTTGLYLVGV